MLNRRLYRTSLLVCAAALVITPLTLNTPSAVPGPEVPPVFEGGRAQEAAQALKELSPNGRSPGSLQDREAAEWVRQRLTRIGTSGSGAQPTVRTQRFVVRTPNGRVSLENVYMVAAAQGAGRDRPAILVVAPRDTPAGAVGGETGTALLVELARLSTTTQKDRPVFFVSTSGSTLGNAGIRWFLRQFSNVPITAAVVLDGPGESAGTGIHLWDSGSAATSARGFRQVAAVEAERLDARVTPQGAFWSQMVRYSVRQATGDQAPLIDQGIPAVTISARPESPLPSRPPLGLDGGQVVRDRLTLVGKVSQSLIATLDGVAPVPRPGGEIVVFGRLLQPAVLRIALLLALLPVLIAALDIGVRLRRSGIYLGRGLRAMRWRVVAPLVVLVAGHVFAALRLLPESVAGRPPLPADVSLSPVSILGLVLTGLIGAGVWRWAHRRVLAAEALPPTDAAGAIIVMAGVLLAAWWFEPFSLVIALPAAHAALLAELVTSRRRLALLGLLALAPVLLAALVVGDLIGRGVPYTLWYLLATTFAGSRGLIAPVALLIVAVCIWTVASPVIKRPLRVTTERRPRRPLRPRPVRRAEPQGAAPPP